MAPLPKTVSSVDPKGRLSDPSHDRKIPIKNLGTQVLLRETMQMKDKANDYNFVSKSRS